MKRTIIIEDELTAATELERMLKGLPKEICVEKVLHSVEDSIAWLQSHKQPDIIFSDIVLNDDICFNIFKKVKVSCPVIYCTAYNKYALEAFRNNGIDYLLKPISAFDLEECFIKLENIQHWPDRSKDLYKEIQRLTEQCDAFYSSTILCYFREQIIPISTDSIKYICTENRFVYIYTEEKPYSINNTLDQLMSVLNPYQFFRANRNYIIHRNAIESIKKVLGRKLNVKLALPDSPIISVGKDKTSEFKKWLEGRAR